jgi:hypothetical protein
VIIKMRKTQGIKIKAHAVKEYTEEKENRKKKNGVIYIHT